MPNTRKLIGDDNPNTTGPIRPRLTLREIEQLIRKYRIIVPCPSRQTLIRLCERGTFETPKAPRMSYYTVFADSFWQWAYAGEDQPTEVLENR